MPITGQISENDIPQETQSNLASSISSSRLELEQTLSADELKALEGVRPSSSHYTWVLRENADAFDANTGRLIFRFRKSALSSEAVELAGDVFGNIDKLLRPSYTRQSAAGKIDLKRIRRVRPDVERVHLDPKNPFQGRFELKSGRVLKLNRCNPVSSYFAGYNFDRYRRLALATGFTKEHPAEWERSVPFFEEIGRAMEDLLPEVTARMHRWCSESSLKPNFTIGDTCLTSAAINVNYDSCFHFDRGDWPGGCSTLTALEIGGDYTGGYLVVPGYSVAIDIREGDLLVNQSHVDLHGNTEINYDDEDTRRISFVTYLKKTLSYAKNLGGCEGKQP